MSSTCITSTMAPSPVLANIHSIFAYDVPHTEDVGLPTKCRFNVRPALQPIAGSMTVDRLRRWPSTNLSQGLLYSLRKHVSFNQNCFNVDPQSSTLVRHWNTLGDCTIFSNCWIILVTFKNPGVRNTKKHDTLAQCWCNTGPPSATLGQHYSNQNQQLLTTNIIVNIIISEHLLKTKLLELRTWNFIFDKFIRTDVQKCQPFPTHSTLFPLNRTQTQAK